MAIVNKEEQLSTESIPKLMLRLALPAVAAQFINVLYNIVDRIYIGNIPEIGTMALSGVGVTFPIIMLISAFSAFAGMGGAPLASIRMGAGDKEGAEKILGNCFTILITLSAILTIAFLVFKRPLLYAFGASDAIFSYANDYISIYLVGTVFVQIALGLNTFISAQGHATTAMLSVLIGAVINIVLDPILIFGLNMGVKGAALATIISQAVSAAWVVSFLFGKKTSLKIRTKNLVPDKKIIGSVAALGIAPFIMQSTESLVTIVLNRGLQAYGNDLYVGSMTIIQSIMQMIVMPVQGITQGVQPIISYNYGAGNYERVRKTFFLLLRTTLTITIVACVAVMLIPGVFTRMFTPNAELIALTSRVMPIFMAGIWAFGAQMACQTTFMALGQAKTSLFLALLRKVFLLVPLALILPAITNNVLGIYAAEPIADVVASTTTLCIFLSQYKKLLPKDNSAPKASAKR